MLSGLREKTAILVMLLLGSLMTVSSSAQNRLSCEWSHSIAVTATATSGAHNDAIRVDLTSSDFPATYAMSANGDDLRVYLQDNTTAVPFFISRWDQGSQQATIFILPPPIGAGGSATYNFFLGNSFVASESDADAVFPTPGLRVLSRASTANPSDAASGYSALVSANSTIADQVRSNVRRINNRTLGGSDRNFGLCISTLINVPSSQVGLWSFRAGMDYGRGGHLRLAETDLDSRWTTDLWWALNFGNSDVLQNSRLLGEGWHRIELLGFEGCCDGRIEVQASAPGGSFQDLRTSNFTLRAAPCTNLTITTSTVTEQCPIGIDVTKSSVAVVDLQGTDFRVPGATVTYEIGVTNLGQRVDATTINILDDLPGDVSLLVDDPNAFELIEGTTPSGLLLDWGGFADASDDVEFSTDGVDFSYVPVPDADGTDANITHVRIVPDGSLGPADNVTQPSFSVRLRVIIQ